MSREAGAALEVRRRSLTERSGWVGDMSREYAEQQPLAFKKAVRLSPRADRRRATDVVARAGRARSWSHSLTRLYEWGSLVDPRGRVPHQ